MQTWSRVVDDLASTGTSASLQWDELTLTTHFQPIHGLREAGCAGYEALVRARDPAGKAVAPNELFERARQESRELVLDRACRALHLRNFAMTDPGEGLIFLNVLPDAAVEDASRVHDFAELIGYYGLVPRRVCLEVLEHDCGAEPELRHAVAAYRGIGVDIAMDDFGTGRSNFDRISALRPDFVKLHRCMLEEAIGQAKGRQMLPALVEMLQETGASVVIEGVESANETLLAMNSGACFVQGNYLARPAARIGTHELSVQMVRKLQSMSERAAVAGQD